MPEFKFGVALSKVYPIELFDVRYMGIRMYNTLKKYEKRILADYEKTVGTWKHHVEFHSEVKFSGAHPRVIVFTNDEIYYEIDTGTEIRYDVMTEGFKPKSHIRVIDSFPGKGGFSYTDYENPRAGIDARQFSEVITKRHESIFADLDRDLLVGFRRRKRRA